MKQLRSREVGDTLQVVLGKHRGGRSLGFDLAWGPLACSHLCLQSLDLDLAVLDLLSQLLGHRLLCLYYLQQVQVLLHERLMFRGQCPVAVDRGAWQVRSCPCL